VAVISNDTQAQVRQASTSMNNALAKRAGGGKELGKEDFLNLLMAQATHQDPLNPMDSQGMMNQLTSMGSLEQMINMNKQLERLGQIQADVSRASAHTFLDKDVTIKGGAASVSQGSVAGLQYAIPREAREVQMSIVDKSGAVVRTLDLGQQSPGRHTATWDARDKDGDAVVDGEYRYSISAKGEDNEAVPAELYSRGKVSGIRFDDGHTLLRVNGQEVDARSVIEITDQSQRLFGNRRPQPPRQSLQPQPARTAPKQ
jgi:flagellar basal-body rod modification protein FlgD